jgi:aminopeptidase N
MLRTPTLLGAVLVTLLAGCSTGEPGKPASPAAPLADTVYPARGTDKLDVLKYNLTITWNPKTGNLTGVVQLQIRPVVDAKELTLDFMPYQLDDVTIDGVPTRASITKEKLTVAEPVLADIPLTLGLRYHGKPRTTPMPSHRSDAEPLGLTVTEDGELWTMQEPYGAYTWYPVNDIPSDEAAYDIAITVPAGWTGIASGTPVGRVDNTFSYTSTDPVAPYLTTLAVGRYKQITEQGPGGLPLTYWYRPGKDDKLVPALKKSGALLTWLESKAGPYPFPSAGAVVVDSASAMETQETITVGSRIGNVEANLLHEYAHQWFGDSVTPTTWKDVWLNEGWAAYLQYLWEAEQGKKFGGKDLRTFLRERDGKLRAQVGPPGNPKPTNFAQSNVYVCPAAMLQSLNQRLGDEKFFALARDWVQTQRNTQQDRASFIAFVNKHTGGDYTAFINTWLDSPTTPSA